MLSPHAMYDYDGVIYNSRGIAMDKTKEDHPELTLGECMDLVRYVTVYCEHPKEQETGSKLYSTTGKEWYFDKAAAEADRRNKKDKMVSRLYNKETIPEPKEFLVNMVPTDDETGLMCQINNHPNHDGRNLKGKIFFPDERWSSPLFVGPALVHTVMEQKHWGFVYGHMETFDFVQDKQKIASYIRNQLVDAEDTAMDAMIEDQSGILFMHNDNYGSDFYVFMKKENIYREPQYFMLTLDNCGIVKEVPLEIEPGCDGYEELSRVNAKQFMQFELYGVQNIARLWEKVDPCWCFNGQHPKTYSSDQELFEELLTKPAKTYAEMNGNFSEVMKLKIKIKDVAKKAFAYHVAEPVIIKDNILIMNPSKVRNERILSLEPQEVDLLIPFMNWLNESSRKRILPQVKTGDILMEKD